MDISGKKILITAGPTHEKIDDVRYISNYSSGKMGFALAEKAAEGGGNVTLITGPVNLATPDNVTRIDIISAEDLYKEVMNHAFYSDIIIMSAAVADFSPEKASGKIKKDKSEKLILELSPTKDILKELGRRKKENQLLIGFALEAENEIEYGRQKLQKKNCDMIIVNSANKPDSGFGGDKNTITILTKSGLIKSFPAMSKKECAKTILNFEF